jgi:hypothetical protein
VSTDMIMNDELTMWKLAIVACVKVLSPYSHLLNLEEPATISYVIIRYADCYVTELYPHQIFNFGATTCLRSEDYFEMLIQKKNLTSKIIFFYIELFTKYCGSDYYKILR